MENQGCRIGRSFKREKYKCHSYPGIIREISDDEIKWVPDWNSICRQCGEPFYTHDEKIIEKMELQKLSEFKFTNLAFMNMNDIVAFKLRAPSCANKNYEKQNGRF